MDSQFWNGIYQKKNEHEVSWFQQVPRRSLELIKEFGLESGDPIIDIGGGDSHLVDALLDLGFKDLTVLDISSVSLEKARVRLGERAGAVNFITSDVTKFVPARAYKLWHDRAAFHFLTSREDIDTYLQTVSKALAHGGFLIVSTFSQTGPEKCSGLEVSRYSDSELKGLFGKYFDNIRCFADTHTTPWGTTQDFVYCGFVKRNG